MRKKKLMNQIKQMIKIMNKMVIHNKKKKYNIRVTKNKKKKKMFQKNSMTSLN